MTKSFVCLVGIAWLGTFGCSGPKTTTQAPDLAAEQAKVKTVLDQFAQAWEMEDTTLFARILAHDPDMVCFGTDSAERFVGWESLRASVPQQLASFDSVLIAVRDQTIKVHPSGEVAWAAETADLDMVAQGQPVKLRGSRITSVLEKRGNDWVIVQFHVSLPVSGQAAQY